MKWYVLLTLILSLEIHAQTRPTGNFDGECCTRPTGNVVSDEELILKDAAYLEEMFLAYLKMNATTKCFVSEADKSKRESFIAPTNMLEALQYITKIQFEDASKPLEQCQFGMGTVIQSDVSCLIGDGALTLAAFATHEGALGYLMKVRNMEEKNAKQLIDALLIMNETGRARLNKLRPIRSQTPKVPAGKPPGAKIDDTEQSRP